MSPLDGDEVRRQALAARAQAERLEEMQRQEEARAAAAAERDRQIARDNAVIAEREDAARRRAERLHE